MLHFNFLKLELQYFFLSFIEYNIINLPYIGKSLSSVQLYTFYREKINKLYNRKYFINSDILLLIFIHTIFSDMTTAESLLRILILKLLNFSNFVKLWKFIIFLLYQVKYRMYKTDSVLNQVKFRLQYLIRNDSVLDLVRFCA